MVMLLIRIYVVVWFLVDDLPLRRYDQIVLPRHQGDPAGSWVASSTSYQEFTHFFGRVPIRSPQTAVFRVRRST